MQFSLTIPILRMLDAEMARAFYVGLLGFQVDWEHRFGADFPVYMQSRRRLGTRAR
jgi:catechol 2,3-dioxygenase-like lactoylglutathione lyase family enzyme